MAFPAVKPPVLSFYKMSDHGLAHGYDLSFSCHDSSVTCFLCVDSAANRVQITGTTPKTRRNAVMQSIDNTAKWGTNITLWMVAEKDKKVICETGKVTYLTHVRPVEGPLTIGSLANQTPKLTYPGNGSGRLLSEEINGKRYVIYGGKLETTTGMRGFDCTSFPMVLFEIPRLAAPGYGKQVGDALGVETCGLDQVSSSALEAHFKADDIPVGIYLLFSEGHVLLYNSDLNMLYEFNYGGFKATKASDRTMTAKNSLWWMRKLPEKYRAKFQT